MPGCKVKSVLNSTVAIEANSIQKKRKEMLPPFWNKVHGSEVSIFVLDFSPQTYMCY